MSDLGPARAQFVSRNFYQAAGHRDCAYHSSGLFCFLSCLCRFQGYQLCDILRLLLSQTVCHSFGISILPCHCGHQAYVFLVLLQTRLKAHKIHRDFRRTAFLHDSWAFWQIYHVFVSCVLKMAASISSCNHICRTHWEPVHAKVLCEFLFSLSSYTHMNIDHT